MKKLKILYLEDSKFDTEILARFLSKTLPNTILNQVDSKITFEKELKDFNPDLILSDHSLFQFNSIEALSIIKKNNMDIPFILLTGTVSEEFAVSILKEGADDYILKNNLSRLPIAIKNAFKEREIKKEKEIYQEKLIEKNNELNTLIYKITHDLRGPVCSILGLVDLAKKMGDKIDFDYIGKITETTIKLDSILQSLIETMHTREADIVADKIDLVQLCHEITQKFEFITEYKKVIVSKENSGLDYFYSDRKIVSSILQNLIENSYKYRNLSIPNPKIDIQIITDSEKTTIRISDNGIGINPEFQGKVFDMFFRGHIESKGSGLGLYLVKKGIEKLQGSFKLESKLNEGTVFTITLPSLKKPIGNGT
jgi:signal transduction histidine kinase